MINTRTIRFPLLMLIFFFSMTAFSQTQAPADSIEIEPIDTNSNHAIGFLLGGGITYGNIIGSDIISTDTFSDWGMNRQALFSVGLLYNKEISSRLSFQSGVVFNLSKVVIAYRQNGYELHDTTNYSTLVLPFLISYKLNDKPSGFKISGGIISEFDISKKADKNNRVFLLKAFSPAVYGSVGYQLQTFSSIIEFNIFTQINPLNLIANDNNNYTNAIEKLSFGRTGFIIILR